ncbi:MAG: 2-C-methyl-D-erythritol 4-phosphate cytidylyltransferase [Chloroflexi bacterium RBG_16_48_7]|nr:MAG: 2-C-methyl-D-erythritol 4-phosphate cytidylyltransferase [Chloroflexi bacterium RBG_16_48_7]
MSKIMKEITGAILVAAGTSSRMGVDKIFLPLAGKPVLAWSLQILQNSPLVSHIVVVLNASSLEKGKNLVTAANYDKVKTICPGGGRRQDSVKNGLEKLGNCRWVIIHDGARPFLTNDMLSDGLTAAKETGSAIAAVPVKDTIKQVGPDLMVKNTLDRDILWAVQTPQVFKFDIISRAHERIREDASDDASMVEKLGYKVKLYQGSYNNIKITTSEDITIARAIARGIKCV